MASFDNFIQRAAGRANERRAVSQAIDQYNGNSIKKMTKDLILQFPLLISQNVSVETASILAGGFEVENTIMLRLLLMNDFGTLTNGTGDLISALRMLHTNIEGKPMLLENLKAANISASMPIEDKFCKWSLNESTLPKYMTFNEDDKRNIGFDSTTKSNSSTDFNVLGLGGEFRNNRTDTSKTSVEFSNDAPFNPKMFDKVNDMQPTFIKIKISISNSTEAERSGSFSANLGPIGKMFGHNNAPNLGQVGSNKTISRTSLDEKEVIFGVKCIAHPLKSEDIIFNIGNEFKNSTLFKLVKWTTGEYGFFKGLGELIFDFSNMKNTGIQAAKTSNYWWYKLRKLKNENKQVFYSSSNSKNAPIKTATLVITKDEVDCIARTYRVDLSMPKFAQRLMNNLYLLNFAYIDESTETVYLYDEPSGSYTIKKFNDFKTKKTPKPLNMDDIKSLFGR